MAKDLSLVGFATCTFGFVSTRRAVFKKYWKQTYNLVSFIRYLISIRSNEVTARLVFFLIFSQPHVTSFLRLSTRVQDFSTDAVVNRNRPQLGGEGVCQ